MHNHYTIPRSCLLLFERIGALSQGTGLGKMTELNRETQPGEQIMTTIRAVIYDRRIDVPAPRDLPDGTEVLVTIGTSIPDDDGPMSPQEIARIHAAMQTLLPFEIPEDVAADLDAWERKVNQFGIDNTDKGIESKGDIQG
jgi:hypothetical protein